MSLYHSAVYRITLRDLVRSKKALFAALVSLVPAILAILVVIDISTWASEEHFTFLPLTNTGFLYFLLPATIPLVALILAGGLIADEAEDRTLSYLLVRPISRQSLYFSRGLAVLTVAMALTFVQFLTGWMVDGFHHLLHADPGQTIRIDDDHYSAAGIYWMWLPVGLVLTAFATTLYVAMFGAGSVLFTRFHFFANLLFLLLWEIGIGFSFAPTAWLSANHGVRALVVAIDPTLDRWDGATVVDGAWGWFGIVPALLWLAVWVVAGLQIVHRRDFHVTSAAT